VVSPQIDNGYMRIANEIVEAIMQAGLNGTQFRIVLAIWRYTYGFNRKSHNISLTFLEKVTGLYKRQIQRELKKLIEMNILLEVSKGKGMTTRELAFNKNYKLWRLPVAINIERRDVELDTSNRCLNRHLTGVGLDVSRGVGLDVSRGVGLDTQERHIKDIEIIYCNSDESQSRTVEKETEEKATKADDVISCQLVADLWNDTTTNLPKIKKLTDTRKKVIKARSNDLAEFESVFKKVEASDFLSGRNGSWLNCSFDWVLKQANWVKVIEGNYDNKNVEVKKRYVN
jgi:phage replication O-like protein O